MSRAIAGKPYTVVSGDNLTLIAKQAYGDGSKWRVIWRANQATLRSGDPNLIYPGEIINIPPNPAETEIASETGANSDVTLDGKEKDDMTIVIEGTELLVQSGRAVRTMDTCADAWTATVAWDPDDDALYDLLRPFSYKRASVYLGGVLVIEGILYNSEYILSGDNSRANLYGWSLTADMIDSVIRPPYEQNKVSCKIVQVI